MIVTSDQVNAILGITEAHEMPERMMSILRDKQQREIVFKQFVDLGVDLSTDFLREYFQEDVAARKSLKQDYTPDCICSLIAKLHEPAETVIDVCAGSGALTIATARDSRVICEELSTAAVPLLLFNLSIRGIEGTVMRRDVLTRATHAIYELRREASYCTVELTEAAQDAKASLVVSNPPYSLAWEPRRDNRFDGYELAPKSKADYAFVLDVLSRLDESGTAFMILPHGVLFRGQSEGQIRQRLIENNHLDTVIGLPGQLFLNTTIPVVIVILKRHRTRRDVLFIDASRDFKKESKQNTLTDRHIDKIVNAYTSRTEIEKFSHVASLEEIKANDYNLNIPRYVDSFEEAEPIDLPETVRDIVELDAEISRLNKELAGMIKQLRGTTQEEDEHYTTNIAPLLEMLEGK